MRIRSIWGLAPSVMALATLAVFGCGSSSPPPPAAPTAAASGPAPAPTPPPAVASAAPEAPPVDDVAPAGTASSEDEDESMADLKEHHRHHHHGGFPMFIAMSLDSLGTTPDQDAAITKIQTDLRAKMQPAHDAEKNVLSALADGVAAGKINKAKVDAAISQLATAAAGIHVAVLDSITQLHATLTPPERVALIDKLEAHFHVWRDANSEDESAARDAHGGHLGALAKELALSPDQVEKIRTAFKTSLGTLRAHYDPAEGEAHIKAFAAAFESDTFDAKTLPPAGPVNAHIAAWGATRMARLYEAATPVLTPDQRVKLAELLRRHANYKPTPVGS